MDLTELVTYLEKHKLRTMQVNFSTDNPKRVESNTEGPYTDIAGKTWPRSKNGPMRNLLHIKVDELPHVPKRIADLAYITFFVDREYVEFGLIAKEGADVVVRMVPRSAPFERIPVLDNRQYQHVKFTLHDDYPDVEDVLFYLEHDQSACSRELVCDACDLLPTIRGVKLNGYPPTIQGQSGSVYGEDDLGLIVSGGGVPSSNLSLPFGDGPVFQIGWSEFHNGWYSSWDTH